MENHEFIKRWLTFPGGLSSRLRAMRQDAEITNRALADQLGWKPPKVTKIEKGDQFPTADEIRAWGDACSADGAAVDQLLEILTTSRALHLEHRARKEGDEPVQALYSQLMASSRKVTLVETLLVPGPLQVIDYARSVLTMAYVRTGLPIEQIEPEVAERISRSRFIGDPSLELHFIMHESALRMTIDSPATMLAQLDRLQTIVDHPTVSFGIIPFSVPLIEMPRSFGLYDNIVIAETMTGEIVHEGGTQAMRYQEVTDRLWSMAATDEAARAFITAAAETHRAPSS